jgi:hypothetical protein
VSQFVRFGPAARSLRASDSVYVRGFQWKILAIAQQKQNGPQIGQKYFSYYLMCNIGDGNTGLIQYAQQKNISLKSNPGLLDHLVGICIW